jgi:hypothetical protein
VGWYYNESACVTDTTDTSGSLLVLSDYRCPLTLTPAASPFSSNLQSFLYASMYVLFIFHRNQVNEMIRVINSKYTSRTVIGALQTSAVDLAVLRICNPVQHSAALVLSAFA